MIITTLSIEELRLLRLKAQCLMPRANTTALIDVVKALVGVQAQLPSAMELALRARVNGLTVEDVNRCRVEQRAVVRTWCMRGSMHLLATDELGWLLGAISPAILRGAWRWFERRHKLTQEQAERIVEDAYQTLKSNGAMTRRDLMNIVARGDKAIEATAHGVMHVNAILGRVCVGDDDGAEPTYVALDDWLGHPLRLEPADYVRLARRYLQGYGPADARDFAEWWELPLTQAKKTFAALQDELHEISVEGQTLWATSTELPVINSPTVYLLPGFDTYSLGYANRDVAVPKAHQASVFRDGMTAPIVVVDGCAVGTWRYEKRGKQIAIRVEAWQALNSMLRDLIAAEAADIGRFYGLTPDLHFEA